MPDLSALLAAPPPKLPPLFPVPIPHLEACATGSTVICPEVPPKDRDTVALVADLTEAAQRLLDLRWRVETDLGYNGLPSAFVSAREGDRNLIVTASRELFNRFRDATRLALALRLTEKRDRVCLFQYVLYGNLP